MGSRLRLVVTTDDREIAARAWDEVRDEFAILEAALSRFDPRSALSTLNREAGSGTFHRIPVVLRNALALADRAERATSGRFDATIIYALEEAGERAGVPLPRPSGASIAAPDRWLEIRCDRVRLGRPVDLGGIGKGLALRQAARRLRDLVGLEGYLIDAGGDLVVAGVSPDAPVWRLAIEDPNAPGIAVVGLTAGRLSLATSSVAVRHWEGAEGPVHHLIDPSTGRPARSGLLAVSVAHTDPAWAEVWSKALFVAGVDAIASLADRMRLPAWWVRDDERVGASVLGRATERFRLRAA